MASIYKRTQDKARKGSSWYIGYVDDQGRQRTTKGCPDKTTTEAMRKLKTMSPPATGPHRSGEDAYRNHDARPLMEHLAAWRVVMLAKGRTARTELSIPTHPSRDVGQCGRLSDLQPSQIQAALAASNPVGPRNVQPPSGQYPCLHRWRWADGRAG
ncbi:MAG: hypothetical protein WKF75_08070 [Singulisphaera sp.]